MVQIALIVFAVLALFLPRIKLTKASELRRPRTYAFGAITLAMVAVQILADNWLHVSANTGFVVYSVSVVVPLAAALLLKQPIVTEKS